MAQFDELPVYKATYDLLIEIFRFTKDFNKDFKYTVGESLKKETIELIILIYSANSRIDKQATIQAAREHIEVIRLLVPLMKDMHQISLKRYVEVNKQVENVSKQLTGWQKNQKYMFSTRIVYTMAYTSVQFKSGNPLVP